MSDDPTVIWFEPCPDKKCAQRAVAHNHDNTYWAGVLPTEREASRVVSVKRLPAWAEEWGPDGVFCCGQQTVKCASFIVCAVTGWAVDNPNHPQRESPDGPE